MTQPSSPRPGVTHTPAELHAFLERTRREILEFCAYGHAEHGTMAAALASLSVIVEGKDLRPAASSAEVTTFYARCLARLNDVQEKHLRGVEVDQLAATAAQTRH